MTTFFRLRRLLLDKRMSQTELARRSGVSIVTINGICTNRTGQVSLDTLDKIATALGVKPGEILAQADTVPPTMTANLRHLAKPLSNLGSLSARTVNALNKAGIETVGDLASLSENALLQAPGIGEKALAEIEALMRRYGIKLDHEDRAPWAMG